MLFMLLRVVALVECSLFILQATPTGPEQVCMLRPRNLGCYQEPPTCGHRAIQLRSRPNRTAQTSLGQEDLAMDGLRSLLLLDVTVSCGYHYLFLQSVEHCRNGHDFVVSILRNTIKIYQCKDDFLDGTSPSIIRTTGNYFMLDVWLEADRQETGARAFGKASRCWRWRSDHTGWHLPEHVSGTLTASQV